MKLIKKKKETIAERNSKFSKANKVRRKIILAKDVIAQIEAQKFIAKTGSFCTIEEKDTYYNPINSLTKETSLQKLINNNKNQCNVCALGGIFTSLISITNNFNINSYQDPNDKDEFWLRLAEVFTPKELIIIENAFEQGNGFFNTFNNCSNILESWNITEEQFNKINTSKAISFGQRYLNLKDRMIAIMSKIIKDKGEVKF